MGLIIDDLAKIIRKHQKTLPCVEPLDVNDNFAKVYKETEDGDLTIHNEMYSCIGLRKVHLEIATLGPLDILHCVWYPDPEFDLPIFGADIVANNNIVSAAITDVSPVDSISHPIYDDLADISRFYSFKHNRDVPSWGNIFSPYYKFARLDSDSEKNEFCHVVDQYLEVFVGAVWKSTRDNYRADYRYDGQIQYCENQKKNDKTRKILEKYFGVRWAKQYIDEILFDEP
jgi:phycocyanobilin:ferredoxin oxidoreductase|tara:strand:+ start:185 stop:871 length:687 start_codon:yes stop_codon:yes gene_type:complete